MATSAGSIFDISKYRDTCESSISILSGIAIHRYFCIERPLFDTYDNFDTYDTYDTFNTFDTLDTFDTFDIFDIEFIRRRRCLTLLRRGC